MSAPFKAKDIEGANKLIRDLYRRLDEVDGSRGSTNSQSANVSANTSRAASNSTNISSVASKVLSAHP